MQLQHCFQTIFNIRKIKPIQIRQPGFYSLKISMKYYFNDEQIKAVPIHFLIQQTEENNQSYQSINQDLSIGANINRSQLVFYSKRFLVRFPDQQIEINETCVFKGFLSSKFTLKNSFKVFCTLLLHQSNQILIIDQWQGYSLQTCLHTCFPIYMFNYQITCSIEVSIHSIVSQGKIKTKNLQNILQNTNNWCDRGENIFISKKDIYDQHLSILCHSYQFIWNQIKQIINFDLNKTYSKKVAELLDTNSLDKIMYNSIKLNIKQQQNININNIEINSYFQKVTINILIQYIERDLAYLSHQCINLWKLFVELLIKYSNSLYFNSLKQTFKQNLKNYRYKHEIIISNENSKIISRSENCRNQFKSEEKKYTNLGFYPFEAHSTEIKISEVDYQKLRNIKRCTEKQLIILVHGYQASNFDMQFINMHLRFQNPMILTMISSTNQGRTQQNIEDSAHRLAIQIKNFINIRKINNYQISFICHSMGGLIVRASLKYLQMYKNQFRNYISLNTPHLGYLYHSSTIVKTSLWIMNNLHQSPSMLQLTMTDQTQLKNTYLYKLSTNNNMTWFQNVVLIGSKQDHYAPFQSVLLQQKSFFFSTQSSKTYEYIFENFQKPIHNKLIRIQINYHDKISDLSTFIGRTAHIKLLNHLSSINLIFSILNQLFN